MQRPSSRRTHGLWCVSACFLAAPGAATAQVYTWDVAGVITDNAGVTALPTGSPFNYRFSYNIDDVDVHTRADVARYAGPDSNAQININGYQFNALPSGFRFLEIASTYSPGSGTTESIGFGAGHVSAPAGWSFPLTQSTSFSWFVQNVPAQGAITTFAPPTQIELAQWVRFRELRMDFHDGVTFPGGSLTGRRTVFGEIQSITLVPAPAAATPFLLLAAAHRRRRPQTQH